MADQPHNTPLINRNPAEAEVDPDQLNPDGTSGDNYSLYENTESAQTAGDRNPRVMNVEGDKHTTEGTYENTATAYDTSENGDASGITNRLLAEEKASQQEVGSEQRGVVDAAEPVMEGSLPKDSVTETVEISTLQSKR